MSEDTIREKYKELNLWTKTASGNFKTNIKNLIGSKKYLSSYGTDSYVLTQCGKEQAQAIIFGEDKKTSIKNGKVSKAVKNTLVKYDFIDLNLTMDDKKNLLDIFSSKDNLNTVDKVVLASYWYKVNKKEKAVTKDIVFSLLKNANISTSFNIQTAMINAKTRNNYFFSTGNKGEYEITHIGEEYIANNIMLSE